MAFFLPGIATEPHKNIFRISVGHSAQMEATYLTYKMPQAGTLGQKKPGSIMAIKGSAESTIRLVLYSGRSVNLGREASLAFRGFSEG